MATKSVQIKHKESTSNKFTKGNYYISKSSSLVVQDVTTEIPNIKECSNFLGCIVYGGPTSYIHGEIHSFRKDCFEEFKGTIIIECE